FDSRLKYAVAAVVKPKVNSPNRQNATTRKTRRSLMARAWRGFSRRFRRWRAVTDLRIRFRRLNAVSLGKVVANVTLCVFESCGKHSARLAFNHVLPPFTVSATSKCRQERLFATNKRYSP